MSRLILVALFVLAALLSGCADLGTALRTQAESERARADAVNAQAQAQLTEAEQDAATLAALERANQRYAEAMEARVREAQTGTALSLIAGAFVALVLAVVVVAVSRTHRTTERHAYPLPPPDVIDAEALPVRADGRVLWRGSWIERERLPQGTQGRGCGSWRPTPMRWR